MKLPLKKLLIISKHKGLQKGCETQAFHLKQLALLCLLQTAHNPSQKLLRDPQNEF